MADIGSWEIIARLFTAAVLGAVLGAEREADGQDAGLRTHLMLALGAALFGLVSVGGFDDFAAERDATNFQVDVTRVASYVAAGIGLLGGGVILKHAGGVRGLTTAASLWVAAAIGLACGVGFWVPALVATAVGVLSLAALRPVRALLQRYGRSKPNRAVIVLAPNADPGAVVGALMRLPVAPTKVTLGRGEHDNVEILSEFATRDRVAVHEGLAGLGARADVRTVRADADA